MLNQFFDYMAGSVLDQGGEVLKFIGDAILAIFPIEDPDSPEAAGYAIDAAQDAQRRIAIINQHDAERGTKAIGFGVGMHIGNLMYGDIGTQGRLDFTVIGAAVNKASRIESMCKTLDKTVLFSEVFARHFPTRLVSLGAIAGWDPPRNSAFARRTPKPIVLRHLTATKVFWSNQLDSHRHGLTVG